MIRAFKTWLLKREIERSLAARRIVTQARREAAQRGVSTDWKRRAERCRVVFGDKAA